MADKTVADLPKKNAAPAEPAKSLQATVQQVMNKAITSPTDAKVDFAQGVNHITGDPQQKSAGPADAMQSLKAEADPKKTTYSNANEADEKKDKEKEDMKEVADKEDEKKKDEMMKASKDKEDMKEGEMPAGLKKYLDKKNGKEEEADKEKKDVKEVADKEKEKEHKEEDEKKKEKMDEMMKASKDHEKKDEVKEVADKDDEKKKEVSEVADKEKEAKKEMTAKDKVKDMDMKEDVAALTDGEDLSEEFKQKASTIFEAAVKAKLVEEIEKLEGEYETKVAEKVEETKSEIVEKVDAYLNYVVEEWMKENELAIEKGLRAEITEDFIGGLKSLFESHYINVPQEKYDVIEAQTAEIEKLKEEVNQTIEKNVELNQAIGQHVRQDIINDVSSDLAETESEKLKGLAESIEYKDAESFRTSVETLKNSYFPKAKASETESNEVAEQNAGADLSESMAAYTAAISKSKKNPYLK